MSERGGVQTATRTPAGSGKEQLIKVCVRMKPTAKEKEVVEDNFWQIREGRHILNLRSKDQFTFGRGSAHSRPGLRSRRHHLRNIPQRSQGTRRRSGRGLPW